MTTLREYQWDGARFLAARDRALLADEMGLGKTVQVLSAIRLLREEGSVHRALVVAPAALRTNWRKEAERWLPEVLTRVVQGSAADRAAWYLLPVPILITSYEQLRIDSERNVIPPVFDLLVLDEAQRLKEPLAETTVAVMHIKARRIWAMTGTPLENRAQDLETLLRVLFPASLSPSPSLPEVHSVMQGRFLRRVKKDVLPELPALLQVDVSVDLLPQQRAAYEEVWETRREMAGGELLSLLTRLKQVCNFEPVSGESAKLEILLDHFGSWSHSDAKVLIFSQYVETLRWLSQRLPVPSRMFHGGMPDEVRASNLEWFARSDGPACCLISLKAGGVGLNIPQATHVVLFDRWWNPAAEEQAVNRAHRFGRQGDVTVLRLHTVETVEERILELLAEKRQLFRHYVDSVPTDAVSLSSDELRRLLDMGV